MCRRRCAILHRLGSSACGPSAERRSSRLAQRGLGSRRHQPSCCSDTIKAPAGRARAPPLPPAGAAIAAAACPSSRPLAAHLTGVGGHARTYKRLMLQPQASSKERPATSRPSAGACSEPHQQHLHTCSTVLTLSSMEHELVESLCTVSLSQTVIKHLLKLAAWLAASDGGSGGCLLQQPKLSCAAKLSSTLHSISADLAADTAYAAG